MLTRRNWFLAAGAAPSAMALAQTNPAKEIVISSANGLAACDKALSVIQSGGDTLDAVVAGVTIVENDPEDNSVGYGGLPNELGVVELDASVMHGPTRRAGSVASVQNIKNPAKLAKMVMEQTDHIMLVGRGALDFAKTWGFSEENLLTEKSRLAWLVWKQSLRDAGGHNNWTDGLDAPVEGSKPNGVPTAVLQQFPNTDPELLAWAWEVARTPITGTINCLGLNKKGEMSGVTTTSGLSWKIPGRVGDSPIIGAGLYVDQEVGGAGSTGRGEENIRIAGAHTIVENMRHGMSPKDACLDALKRIARNYNNDMKRLAAFDINFYAMRKDGEIAGASLWSGVVRRNGAYVSRKFAVANGGKAVLQDCVYLYERKA
ncbi:MAG: N(4)-(beta-N-acetylglucosaminyl)-L-asparaginase [Bryobacteraceae bacterium]|nr:N(4)-(beta-N-acetylglucosaminyl)-L-asparaginase [Bryobacteraceae bacterium]